MSNSKKVTIKNISLNKSHLSCHHKAVKSYKLSERFYYQYRKQLSKLPDETIEKFQDLEPLHVTSKVVTIKKINKKTKKETSVKKTQYKFFSGWFWLLLCREKNIKEVRVILHFEGDLSCIEQASWLYLLSCEFKTLHRNRGLAQLSEAIEQVPKGFRKSLLGEHYSWSPSRIIQNLSSETNKVISAQIDKKTSDIKMKTSIFDELIRGD